MTPADAIDAVRALTKREEDILRLVGKGLNNSEVGAVLHISKNTVNDYMKSIFSKLEANSRLEAAVIACKAGWL